MYFSKKPYTTGKEQNKPIMDDNIFEENIDEKINIKMIQGSNQGMGCNFMKGKGNISNMDMDMDEIPGMNENFGMSSGMKNGMMNNPDMNGGMSSQRKSQGRGMSQFPGQIQGQIQDFSQNVKGQGHSMSLHPKAKEKFLSYEDTSMQTPQTVSDVYFTPGFLKTQIGNKIRVEFLIGTNAPMVDRTGILRFVGASYIIIELENTDDLMMCDLYSIKFVTIYR